MSSPTYAFGSGDEAATRLLVLADVFAPAMGALIDELPRRRWPVVIDLGCGPGSSTAHLARLLQVEQLIGLDAAASFVARAAEHVPGATFLRSDAMAAEWPTPPADLIYTRFLLAHLPDPLRWLGHWRQRLGPGGTLLVEENERIDTDIAVFVDYLGLVDGLVSSRGGDLDLGATLAAADLGGVSVNRAYTLEVAPADAATMFALNLRSWRADPWVVSQRTPYELDSLADALEALRQPDGRPAGSIGWTLRQLALAET